MLSCGITAFADFREGGLSGIELAKQALTDCKQRVLLLCRPNLVYSETDVGEEIALPEAVVNETKDALSICSGIGLSGANEHTDMALEQIGQLAKDGGKLIAIHAAESLDAVKFSSDKFHSTEVQRILRYMTPDAIVHATQASTDEFQKIAEHGVGVICCPRANATLGLGFPPIDILRNHGVRVALGTDNVMLNAPDMFREMDYTARMIKATCLNPSAITSAEILQMATASAADILGLGSTIGTLAVGKKADIVFLDLTAPNLNFSRDLVSSVVHRARPDNVACVMIDGEIVHGSIEN
jgi:cytosine/adenosine deaminase-related metal-dependent hydrolase